MAKGFEVDFVKQTITITDATKIDAEGAQEIASLQQAGYKTIKYRKPSKPKTPNKNKGRTKDWYKAHLTEDQYKEFEAKIDSDNWFKARDYANAILDGKEEEAK